METIIQEITQELGKKVTEKAYSGGIQDIDQLCSDILQDCKLTASAIVETIFTGLNMQIRADKAGRKEQGLILKEKDRTRELHTELGILKLPRDYYYDKINDQYVFILDHITGIRPYERIGDNLSVALVTLATDVSYAKSAAIASGGTLSRQTVKNHIGKLPAMEKEPESAEKKDIGELHIYADEDHAHMQKPNKEKGKSSKIVPLVTVTEGMDTENEKRHKTIGTMHFVDESFDTKNLWKSVEGYLDKTYDVTKVKKIFIHGDGGRWIKNGLENFPQTVHVMDGYHLGKRVKGFSNKFPGKKVSTRITKAIKDEDKAKADEILQGLYDIAEDEKQIKHISEFGTYLFGNWNEIVNRKNLNIPGSCTEAQVSHVLSERFSRDPLGWSEAGLGKLAKLRVYVKNGGKITAEDFKKGQKQTYSEYAEQFIKEAITGAVDWTVFEGEPPVFDGASGTQILIQGFGTVRNTLWS
ncbi:MAG: ISLre2 family transposase [Lentihominibacter sp.]|jgi:hypothetical protein